MTSRRVAVMLGLSLIAATVAAPAASERQLAAGNLDIQAKFDLISYGVACPGGVPPEAAECRAHTGDGFVRGLGNVSVTYTLPLEVGPPTCPAAADEPYNLARFGKPLATTGQLSVVGKGEILTFTLAEGAQCVALFVGPEPFNEQEFTITGGTGPFAAASGRGKVYLPVGEGDETWTGTLEVPGLEFDVTAPKLNGAGSKTVRVPKGAKTARVTFTVTATDDVDGAVPVSCQPKSGSRFKLGRTTVGCEATDSSGNTVNGSFTVTVRPRR